MRKRDWICSNCGGKNPKNREVCLGCNSPREDPLFKENGPKFIVMESCLLFPIEEPIVEFTNKDDYRDNEILSGRINIKFPNHCAWCNNQQITGWCPTVLNEKKPGYHSTGEKILNKAIEIGATLTFGVAGNMVFHDNTIYPDNSEIYKEISLLFFLPYCSSHASSSADEVVILSRSHIIFINESYVKEIAEVNNSGNNGIEVPEEVIKQYDLQVDILALKKGHKMKIINGVIMILAAIPSIYFGAYIHINRRALMEGCGTISLIIGFLLCIVGISLIWTFYKDKNQIAALEDKLISKERQV